MTVRRPPPCSSLPLPMYTTQNSVAYSELTHAPLVTYRLINLEYGLGLATSLALFGQTD